MIKNLEIYTDGSSLGNPGPGGWGVVVLAVGQNDQLKVESEKLKVLTELGGGEKNTTNNRMELTGVIEALKYLMKSEFTKCDIHTDSTYVLGGVTSWVENWEKNGWRTANKKPVLNKELWQELIALSRQLEGKISWQKVKGHSGHIHNDKADEIATTFASKQK